MALYLLFTIFTPHLNIIMKKLNVLAIYQSNSYLKIDTNGLTVSVLVSSNKYFRIWPYFNAAILILILLFPFRYLNAQTLQWVDSSNCPRGSLFPYRTTVAVDKEGNVYSGSSASSGIVPHDSVKSIFGADTVVGGGMVLVSTDSNGVYRWAIGGGNTGGAQIYKIATDSFGFVYLFGEFAFNFTLQSQTINATISGGSFCAKLNSSGHLIWLKKIADSSYCYGNVDAAGNLLVAGTFASPHINIGGIILTNTDPTGLSSDIFIAKLDTGGNVIWAGSFGGGSIENVSGICANSSGDIFVTGDYKSPGLAIGASVLSCPAGLAYPYLYIAKFNSSGLPQWGKRIIPSGYSEVRGIASDAWNNVYITGEHEGTIHFGTDSVTNNGGNLFFLAKYDNGGNILWAKGGINPNHEESPYSVATDNGGNIWVGGSGGFVGGGGGLFLFKYSLGGSFVDSIYITLLGSGWIVQYDNIALNNNGAIYIAGNYPISGCVISGDTLKPHDSTLIAQFIAKYSYPFTTAPLGAPGQLPKTEFMSATIFPNPSNGYSRIAINGSGIIATKVEIYDLTGRLLQTGWFDNNSAFINTAELQQGIYLCRVYADNNTHCTMKLFVSK